MFKYDESRQTPKEIFQIINDFLAIFCTILCNRHQFHSFTFLLVHPLTRGLVGYEFATQP